MKNNFDKVSLKEEARVELHDSLNLSGAEVSINVLPAGANVPFVHNHKQNEEIYIVLDGQGQAHIEDQIIDLTKGDCLRISPNAKRQLFASADTQLKYICIQVKENSLAGYTAGDAVIV